MSFSHLFWAADWDGLYRFLTFGSPPLALQLLVLNTVFLVFYIIRKATAKHRLRETTVYVVQGVLVACNMALLFQHDAWRIVANPLIRLFT